MIVPNTGTAVRGDYGAVLTLTNNMIAFNRKGVITTTGARAAGSRNLWWRTGANAFTGTQALVEDPRLADDGYHLGPGSPAVDVALNVGVVRDVDGDRRPIGPGYDVGADERWLTALLPLVLRGQG